MRLSKRPLVMAGAWVVATLATAGVALAVVGLAGEQIADEAVRPLSAAEVEALGVQAPAVVSTVAVIQAPSSTVPEDSAAASDTTATTDRTDVTASTPPSTPPSTSVTTTTAASTTTAPPVSTTTTTVAETAQIDSRQITGGTVVVRWTPSTVELVSASPTDGFIVDIEKRGPEKVEIEFEGDGIKSKYSAEVSDGELVVQTSVENESDGD